VNLYIVTDQLRERRGAYWCRSVADAVWWATGCAMFGQRDGEGSRVTVEQVLLPGVSGGYGEEKRPSVLARLFPEEGE